MCVSVSDWMFRPFCMDALPHLIQMSDSDMPLWSNTKSVYMTRKISILGEKNLYDLRKYKENPILFLKSSVFSKILRVKKIYIY